MATSSTLAHFCSTCHSKVYEIQQQPDGTESSSHCPLCRLVAATIAFTEDLNIQGLQSYAIEFVRLIYDHDILGSAGIYSNDLRSEKHWNIQCSNRDYQHKELYTKSVTKIPRLGPNAKAEDYKPVTTAWVHRAVVLHHRIPLATFGSPYYTNIAPISLEETSNDTVSSLLKVPPTTWSSRFESMRKFLHTCDRHHPQCKRGISSAQDDKLTKGFPYAIRLLKIESAPSGTKLCLSIFYEQVPPYVTLSHRWNTAQPWRTTKENFDLALLQIQYDDLPKTFQDAVIVAQELGIEFLWVDSISIIQDDNNDWTQQSSQMGLIFAHATCTLAAIDAFSETEDDMGLMPPFDKVPTKVTVSSSFESEYDTSHRDESGRTLYLHKGEPVVPEDQSRLAWKNRNYKLEFEYSSFEMSVDKSVWNQRGWILQERILSKRVLYFTKEQVLWECAEGVEDEQSMRSKGLSSELPPSSMPDGDSSDGSQHLHHILRIHESLPSAMPIEPVHGRWREFKFFETWMEHRLFQAWWLTTERYTQCSLTYTRDRWFAIQGLCDVLQHKYKSICCAGIWDKGVGAGLLWHASTGPLIPFPDFTAPSWSWLGLGGPITYAYQDESYTGFIQDMAPLITKFTFVNVNALNIAGDTGSSKNLFGFSGSLILTCRTSLATVSVMQFKDCHFREKAGYTNSLPAWKFFRDISENRSEVELQREYNTVDLPPSTRLLLARDQSSTDGEVGRAIGWVVLDQDIRPSGRVLCASVVFRVLHGQKDIEHHILECIVLEENDSTDKHMSDECQITYRRIGRGRIVEKDWISKCNVETICCV